MDKNEIRQNLIEKLMDNYADYMTAMGNADHMTLLENAEEIASTKMIYGEMTGGRYNPDYFEFLLQFKNPLEIVRDKCLDDFQGFFTQNLDHQLWDIADKQDALMDYELDPAYQNSEPKQGMEMQ